MTALAQSDLKGNQNLEGECEFCALINDRDREVLAENGSFLVVFDNYPVNQGHVLLIAKRHVETPFELKDEEGRHLISILRVAKRVLDKRYNPAGYNIGINAGNAAGQTVGHLHVHLIPRYDGDVPNPRGGVRNLKQPLVNY